KLKTRHWRDRINSKSVANSQSRGRFAVSDRCRDPQRRSPADLSLLRSASAGALAQSARASSRRQGDARLSRFAGLHRNRNADFDVDLRIRSEEHTSELQSRGHLVCRLLLEKKKKKLRHRTTCSWHHHSPSLPHCRSS